jgi:hypothetical protein
MDQMNDDMIRFVKYTEQKITPAGMQRLRQCKEALEVA